MKATIVRKAGNLADWKSDYESIKRRGEADSDEVVIEKTVTISNKKFLNFCEGLLIDQPFIIKNKKLMRNQNKVWHCIAVTSNESSIIILVESSGYDYARYTAIIEK